MNNKFLLATALISATALAEQDNIPEVVVTAKGEQTLADVLPTSHVFTLEQIEALQVKDLPALLDRVNGLTVRDSGGRGSVTSVFVRGASPTQNVVLIDGVRVGSATLGLASLNNYPIEAIERVEVVKGPLSGIYGADAVGGVIHIFTKKGGTGIGSARAAMGSDGLTEYGLAFNGGNDKHSFRVSADYEDSDGIDRTSLIANGADDDDSFEEKAFSFAGKSTLGENTIAKLSVLYSENTTEFDDLFGGVSNGLLSENKTISSALNITSQINQRVRWTTVFGINKDELVTPPPSAFPSAITTNRNSLGTEFAIDLTANSILTVGMDYYQEDIESTTLFPVIDRDNRGAFVQYQGDFGRVALVTSLRHDNNSAYGSDSNGSVAINVDLTDSLRAVLSYGTAFVAPSFNTLYFPNFGNPDLLPEESESVELSLLGNHSKFEWRVSAYQTDIENLHSFDPVTFTAANIGEAELAGIEFEISTQLAEWELSSSVDLLSADNKITDKQLDDRAERTFRLAASRDFGVFGLRFDVKAESGRFDNRGTELPSYALFDISGNYQINQQLRLSINVDNVFGKDYTVNLIGADNRYNTEGRQAKLTLRYQF